MSERQEGLRGLHQYDCLRLRQNPCQQKDCELKCFAGWLVKCFAFSANARLGAKLIAVGSAGLFLTSIKSHETSHYFSSVGAMCHQGRTWKTLWNRYWVMVTVAHFKTRNLKVTRQHLNARKSTFYEILVTVGIPILDKRVFAKIRYVFWEPAVPRSSIRYLDGWRLDHLENTTVT